MKTKFQLLMTESKRPWCYTTILIIIFARPEALIVTFTGL